MIAANVSNKRQELRKMNSALRRVFASLLALSKKIPAQSQELKVRREHRADASAALKLDRKGQELEKTAGTECLIAAIAFLSS